MLTKGCVYFLKYSNIVQYYYYLKEQFSIWIYFKMQFSHVIAKLNFQQTLIQNNDFIRQFFSSASPYSAILESITYVNNVCCSVSAAPYVDALFTLFPLWSERKQHICIHTLHTLFTYVILSKMAL